MKQREMDKVNLRIQEHMDNWPLSWQPSRVKLDTRKRNRAKRLARKLRGK